MASQTPIKINKNNRGLFTRKSKAAGMSVGAFASHVLSNKDNYSTKTIEEASFVKNIAHAQNGMKMQPLQPYMPPQPQPQAQVLYNPNNLNAGKQSGFMSTLAGLSSLAGSAASMLSPTPDGTPPQAQNGMQLQPYIPQISGFSNLPTYSPGTPTTMYDWNGNSISQPIPQTGLDQAIGNPTFTPNLNTYSGNVGYAKTMNAIGSNVTTNPWFTNPGVQQGATQLSNNLTGAAAVKNPGGNDVGNTLQAIAPLGEAANFIAPGSGPLVSAGISAVGGLINLFGHHKKPQYHTPDVKVIRPIQGNTFQPQGYGSSALMANGGMLESYANGGSFTTGEKVGWNSEAGHVQGTIKAIHTSPFQVSGKDGTKYTKHASKDNPMYEMKSNISDHIAYHFGNALHKMQDGGYINDTGYLSGSDTESNPYNIIKSNQITMSGVDYPVMAYPNNDQPQMMYPENNYSFPNSDYVTEIPQNNMPHPDTMAKNGMNFSSVEAYHKWLGYIESNGLAQSSPGNTPVSINGKEHKVDHSMANGGNIDIPKDRRGIFSSLAKKHNMGTQQFAKHVLANTDDYSDKVVHEASFAKNFSKAANGKKIEPLNPEHKGELTEKAQAHHMSVSGFAHYVMAHKDNFDTSTIKQANFAINAAGWNKKKDGGTINENIQPYYQEGKEYDLNQNDIQNLLAAGYKLSF